MRGAETLANCTVSGLGIGIPGTVDTESGYVANAVNVGVAGLELGSLVEAELGLRTAVENDVNAAAIGAHYLLADGDASGSSAYLNLGTGLAAGYVSKGVVSVARPELRAKSGTSPPRAAGRGMSLRPKGLLGAHRFGVGHCPSVERPPRPVARRLTF